MRKLIAVKVFAGVLSVPFVVFAESSWYGSLRFGVESSDSQISFKDVDFRWGFSSSAKSSDELTAVYRFEMIRTGGIFVGYCLLLIVNTIVFSCQRGVTRTLIRNIAH